MPYRELTSGWSLSYGEGSVSGQRVFVDDPNGPIASLPAFGSLFPDSAAIPPDPSVIGGAVLKRIDKKKFGKQADVNQYTCQYEARSRDTGAGSSDDDGSGGKDYDPEFLPRSMEMSAEAVEVGSAGNWQWKSDNNVIPTSGDDKIAVTKRIVTGSLTIEKVMRNLDTDRFLKLIGKLGSISGAYGSADNWLLAGVTAQEELDEEVGPVWRCRATFLYRSVDGGSRGWRHIWRKDGNGKWDRPYDPAKEVTPSGYLYDRGGIDQVLNNAGFVEVDPIGSELGE